MAPALLLFVASTSAEADGDATSSALQAASQALGAGARVALSRYSGAPPGDAELSAAAHAGQVNVAARLIWIGPMWRPVHQESTLHFSGTRLRYAVGYPAEFGGGEPPRSQNAG